MIALYDDVLNAECYTVRLMAALLGVPLDVRPVDTDFGDVPLLHDAGLALHEPAAMLTYLAASSDRSRRWWPREGKAAADVTTWLAFSDDLRATAGNARRCASRAMPDEAAAFHAGAHRLLRVLDEHLWFSLNEHHGWLCSTAHPTIADIACFAPVMLAPEGGIALLEYPSVLRWTLRVKKIPGFTVMPGIFPA